jgi:hypothetical protein
METLALEDCIGVVAVAIGVAETVGMAVTVGVAVIIGVGVGIPSCFPAHPEKRTTSPITAIRIIDLNCPILKV